MSDDFLLPGVFDSLVRGDASALHLAGLENPHVAYDPVDVFPDDTVLIDPEGAPPREHLPQFGPPFVKFVDDRFTRLERLVERLMEKWSYEPVTAFFVASVQTTAAGGLSLNTTPNCSLYEPPPGFTFALHRLTIFTGGTTGNTFATPYTLAASGWELRVNDQLVDGNSMISGQGQLPIVATWGTRDAPRIRDGEVLSLFMVNGPASTLITVKGQGTLDRTIEG